MQIRPADPDRLDDMAALAAECQADPERHIAYLSDQADAIGADLTGVDDWPSVTWVALEGDALLGWLAAESDADMGRIWWWGPLVADIARWDETAEALYLSASRELAALPEEEMVADVRSSSIAALAERHGFHREEGSLLMARSLEDSWPLFHEIDEATPADHPAIVDLHDRLFPNTHTPGRTLVADDGEDRILLVAHEGDTLAGYLVAELQNDGSLYVDFVGVAPDRAGRGFGRRLVSTACGLGSERGATRAHLSVRESNQSARALYASLAFAEERLVVPYRKGFSLQ